MCLDAILAEFREEALPAGSPEILVQAQEPVSSVRVRQRQRGHRSKTHRWKNWVGDVIFYGFLILLAVVTVRHLTGAGPPKRIAGYSAAVVLTGSMQKELPQGSLIVTKQTDPSLLQIGDDITYLVSPTTTVTHRIVGITEDYQNTGQRAFWTKGIMNEKQDELPVPAVNVVGKVIFHNLTLGRIVQLIQRDWPLLLFILLVLFALSRFLIWLYQKPKQEASFVNLDKHNRKDI